MIRKFKFFEGIIEGVYVFPAFDGPQPQRARRIRTRWAVDDIQPINYGLSVDAEAELSRLLASEMARAIDENMVNELTRRINGGYRA